MATTLPNLPNGVATFLYANGSPLALGSVYFYNVGTLVPATTWQDSAGTVPNTNPIVLNSAGQAVIFGTGSYRQIVKDAAGNTIWDQVVTDGGISALANTSDMTQGVALIGGAGRVVSSIAILRTLPKTGSKQAFVTSYYGDGKGGGGPYAIDPNDTTSADNGFTIIVASDGGRWKLPNTAIVTVQQAGAKGDGTTDDTAAFAAAALIGGRIRVPSLQNNVAAVYVVSSFSLLVAGTHLEGDGEGIVTIKGNSASYILNIGDGAINPNQITVSGITFDYSSVQAANAAIRLRRGTNIRVQNIQINANCWNGVEMYGAADSSQLGFYLTDFQINAKNNGIQLGSDNNALQDVFIQRGEIRGCVSGLYIQAVSGLMCDNVDATLCTNGVVIAPTAGAAPAIAMFFDTVWCDTCTDWGWIIKPGAGATVFNLILTDCWASSNGTTTHAGGLSVQGAGNVNVMQINGGIYTGNQGTGIDINLPSGPYQLNGVSCVGNSQKGSAQAHGVAFKNANNFTIVGGTFGAGGSFTNLQDYGIYIDTGNSNWSIVGADLNGNVTGPISDASAGNGQVMGCPGYTTFQDGMAQVANAATTATVSVSVTAPFTAADILITPQSDSVVAGIGTWWISAVTPTSFTLSTHSASAGAWTFTWAIRTKT